MERKSTKESYYRDSFYQNKNDQEKLWKVINELASIKKKKKVIPLEVISSNEIVHNPQSICEIMNIFFVNVCKNLADKIQPITNRPSSFPEIYPVLNTVFFLFHVDEIATIIRSLKTKKSNRENDIETKFVKYSNAIISPRAANSIDFYSSLSSSSSSAYVSKFEFKFEFCKFAYEFGKITEFFRVQVRVYSPDTCAVFLGRHDINKTMKDMHLRRCYKKRNLNLHGLINNKYFSDKFFILKFVFSDVEQFYSSSSSSSEKLFF